MQCSEGHCSHCSVCERHTLESVQCTIYSVALTEVKDFMLSLIGRVFKNLFWILILFLVDICYILTQSIASINFGFSTFFYIQKIFYSKIFNFNVLTFINLFLNLCIFVSCLRIIPLTQGHKILYFFLDF